MSSLFLPCFQKTRIILCDSKCKSSFAFTSLHLYFNVLLALVLLICVDSIDHYSSQKRRNDHLDPYFAIIVLILSSSLFII